MNYIRSWLKYCKAITENKEKSNANPLNHKHFLSSIFKYRIAKRNHINSFNQFCNIHVHCKYVRMYVKKTVWRLCGVYIVYNCTCS